MVDIFQPISTEGPPHGIATRGDHPVPRTGIVNTNGPKQTNKFYGNFTLGSRCQGTWMHPYSVSWSRGVGNARAWGLAVSHIGRSMLAYGPSPNKAAYFINPIGIQSIVFGAAELGPASDLTVDSLDAFSANVNLLTGPGAAPAVTFPLVQGMGFVTAIYHNSRPQICTSIFYRSIYPKVNLRDGIVKYRITLEDGNVWLLYSSGDLNLKQESNCKLSSANVFSGVVQLAKCPQNSSSAESIYDSCAGAYASGNSISGSVDGDSGSYQFNFKKQGNGNLLMFALPHHIGSFSPQTLQSVTPIQLHTTTKGLATAVTADSWIFNEPNLPIGIGFAPWNGSNSVTSFPGDQMSIIAQSAAREIQQDVAGASNLDSMYFSGKQLSKYALVVYIARDILKDQNLANTGLQKLKDAFARFANNRQKFPLAYETAWGGLVSTASYVTGDAGVDFGGSYYNDHHFHYGYFIHAAAIIGYLDPSWLPANKPWVDLLARDAANPSLSDSYFPFSRSFDWFHGHSWAKGLFESADGKDQESTSEDCQFAYAIKLWGQTSGNASMEARGNLMLAILRRSLQNYFLMESSNAVQPPQFIHNKVTGILFENKIDHATYFGNNIEYIQGIHMIPILSFARYTRNSNFVREEWETYFSNGRVDHIGGGWRGILYSNLALIDPAASWNFFAKQNFDWGLLDGGQSRSWALVNAAALMQGDFSTAQSIAPIAMQSQKQIVSPPLPPLPPPPPLQSGTKPVAPELHQQGFKQSALYPAEQAHAAGANQAQAPAPTRSSAAASGSEQRRSRLFGELKTGWRRLKDEFK